MGSAEIAILIILLVLMACAYPMIEISEYLNPTHGVDIALAIMLVVAVAYIAINNIFF